jgi:hypothetical protein
MSKVAAASEVWADILGKELEKYRGEVALKKTDVCITYHDNM